MDKISKKNGGDPSKEVQWSSVMNDALVDAFLHQVIIGGRVNGTFTSKIYDNIVKELVENFDMEINKDKRSPEINIAHSRVSSQDAMSSKSKKRRLAEDDELGNVISQSFDNVSKAIDRAIEVKAKCFSNSYGVEVHAALGVLDLDPISKTEAYIFLMENPTYKEMFFGCPDHERKCVLLTLMSRSKN
nr:hypothetical protein CFP56_59433 [Quercus suber]